MHRGAVSARSESHVKKPKPDWMFDAGRNTGPTAVLQLRVAGKMKPISPKVAKVIVASLLGCPAVFQCPQPDFEWEILLMRQTAGRLLWMVSTHALGQDVVARLPSKQDLSFKWAPNKN